MVLAMDRRVVSLDVIRSRVLGMGLLTVLAALTAGCAQMRDLRPSRAPEQAASKSTGYDPYLAAHRPSAAAKSPSAGPDVEIASNSESSTAIRSTAHPIVPRSTAGGAPGTSITLQPPVPIPVAGPTRRDSPASTSPHLADTGDKSRSSEKASAASIIAEAKAKVASLASYQVQINRQERVGETLLPAEDVLLSIRRDPKAVRLEWTEGAHKGREVIYSKSDPSGMMHVHMPESLIPVPNLALAPNSPLVMRTSRHPITEAGFDTIIAAIEASADQSRQGASEVHYAGIETPASIGRPCHKLTQNRDGESWLVYIDTATSLPAMVEAKTSSGDLLERYHFRSVKADVPELLTAEAFDPSKRWGGSPGLLGRIARSGGDANATATPARR